MGLHGDGEQAASLRCWYWCWARARAYRSEGGLSGEPGRVWIWWCGSGVSLLKEEGGQDGEKTGEPVFAGQIGLLVALLATVV